MNPPPPLIRIDKNRDNVKSSSLLEKYLNQNYQTQIPEVNNSVALGYKKTGNYKNNDIKTNNGPSNKYFNLQRQKQSYAEIKNTPVIEDNEIDVLRHNGYCTSIECLKLNHGFEKLKEDQMVQKVSF